MPVTSCTATTDTVTTHTLTTDTVTGINTLFGIYNLYYYLK